jgi:hypothetical protein
MKIEAGKYYRTRVGKKAYTAGFSPFSSTSEIHIISGWVNGSSTPTTWTSDGRQYRHGESENDLVAEWVDPIQTDVTLQLVNRDGFTGVRVNLPSNDLVCVFIGASPRDMAIGPPLTTRLVETPF